MSAPVAPAPAAPVAPAAPAPIAAPAPAAVVPSAPATEAPPTLESMVASLTVEQAETWVPPGEEATPLAETTTPDPAADAAKLTGEQPKVEPPAAFELDVPTPPRMNAEGKKESGVLKLKVASQAEADNVKFHVKRSAQLDTVQQELAARQDDKATLDWFDEQPAEAFHFLAQAKPTSAQTFVADYLRATPQLAAQVLQEIGYEVKPAKDPEALAAKAELAGIKLKQRVETARLSHEKSASEREWRGTVRSVIEEIGTDAGLAAESQDLLAFATIAVQAINKQFPNGASRDELALALQPLVQRTMLMLGNATPAAQAPAAQPSTTAPPSPETFAARDRQMAPFAKLQGGQALASVLAPDAQPKATETLEQMISRLERG